MPARPMRVLAVLSRRPTPLARGNDAVMVKTVPPPLRGETVTSPPIARASCRTDERPSPAPPNRCAIEMLACENGRNSRLISATETPMPESATVKRTVALPLAMPARRAPKAMLPVDVNFTALSIRFSSAARSRTASPITNAGRSSARSTLRLQSLRRGAAAERIGRGTGQRAQVEEILAQAQARATGCARHRRTASPARPDARRWP